MVSELTNERTTRCGHLFRMFANEIGNQFEVIQSSSVFPLPLFRDVAFGSKQSMPKRVSRDPEPALHVMVILPRIFCSQLHIILFEDDTHARRPWSKKITA